MTTLEERVSALERNVKGSFPDRRPQLGPQIGLGAAPVLIGRVGPLLAAQPTADFAVPQNFAHLLLISKARSTAGAGILDVWLRFNGDAGANYGFGAILEDSGVITGATQGAVNQLIAGSCTWPATPTASFGEGDCLIHDYSSATWHSVRTVGGRADAGGSNSRVINGAWFNPVPIQTLTLLPSVGNFYPGSVFAVYGIP